MNVDLKCFRVVGTGHVSREWDAICRHHEAELPEIRSLHPGSLNLRLTKGDKYVPPGDGIAKKMAQARGQTDGNHISTRAKVVELNGRHVEMWIYRGGHPDTDLELLSATLPLEELGVIADAVVSVVIEEV